MKVFELFGGILSLGLSQRALSRQATSVTRAHLFEREFFFKRDDLLTLECNNEVFGNKARKLLSLSQLTPFPNIVSYGGAQGNAMRALALLCRSKYSQLIYLTRPAPGWMKSNPSGNFAESISAGMKVSIVLSVCFYDFIKIFMLIIQHIELSAEDYNQLAFSKSLSPEIESRFQLPPSSLFVNQGVAVELAKAGIYQLAEEMAAFVQEQASDKPWKVYPYLSFPMRLLILLSLY